MWVGGSVTATVWWRMLRKERKSVSVLAVVDYRVSYGGAVRDALRRRKGGEDEKMWERW